MASMLEPLNGRELHHLERFFDQFMDKGISFAFVDGLLHTAVGIRSVSMKQVLYTLQPGEKLVFDSRSQARRILELLGRRWNEILDDLKNQSPFTHIGKQHPYGKAWAKGFWQGAILERELVELMSSDKLPSELVKYAGVLMLRMKDEAGDQETREGLELLEPIFSHPEKTAVMMGEIAQKFFDFVQSTDQLPANVEWFSSRFGTV